MVAKGTSFGLRLNLGTSLVVQWLRLCLPVWGVWVGSIPGRGAKILYASWPKNQNIKQKQYCNKFKTSKKMVHIKKKKD